MSGFEPARRLLDLANLVRREPAADKADLGEILAAHGETPGDVEAMRKKDVAALRQAIERLTELLLETDTDRAAWSINALLDECGARPRLSDHDGHFWHLHVDRGDSAGWDEWLIASSALALAQLLSERGRIAWGECAAPGCRNLFLSDGPGSPRKYCSTTCSTRARVAEHRRRRPSSGATV